MAGRVHTELSSVLTNVWENRYQILYEKPVRNARDDQTIEDRVYAFYAPSNPLTGLTITKEEYARQLNTIVSPPGKETWKKSVRGGFHVWDAGGTLSGTTKYRVYLNVKLQDAVDVFKRIMALASVDPQPPSPPPVPGRGVSSPRPSLSVIRAGLVAAAQRGKYGGGIAAAKIADESQGLTNRPDKIIVYTNEYGGEPIASMLATELSRDMTRFNSDIPPMTRRIAMGVSIGPEVTGTQWNFGTSFGELRCNLIARALLQTMTGRTLESLSESERKPHLSGKFSQARVPVKHPVTGSQNRLDFIDKVAALFIAQGIDPAAPWE